MWLAIRQCRMWPPLPRVAIDGSGVGARRVFVQNSRNLPLLGKLFFAAVRSPERRRLLRPQPHHDEALQTDLPDGQITLSSTRLRNCGVSSPLCKNISVFPK